MASNIGHIEAIHHESRDQKISPSKIDDVALKEEQYIETINQTNRQLFAEDAEVEPELHARTYVAVMAMFLMNFAQISSLQGPPVVLTWIGDSFNDTEDARTWVPNAYALVQAVLGPVICSICDTFQVRKAVFIVACLFAVVGSAIAPKAKSIYELIAAQALLGLGFAAVPLTQTVPSEILPRKWRPMTQGFINIAASLASIIAPLAIGSFTEKDLKNGWRNFYWIQLAVWATTGICIFVGYRPPKRHTRFDHLSWKQKLMGLDLIGSVLIAAGLTLFLVGLNLGGPGKWADARVLGTLISGVIVLCIFALYEWKWCIDGVLHHDLFRGGKSAGRTFAICVWLNFLEGVLTFAYIVFYPILSSSLFEADPFRLAVRSTPYWIAGIISAPVFGYLSSRFRTIREPMFIGFFIFTGAYIGLATIEPDDDVNSIAFAAMAGLGFGAPIGLIIAGVQLATPHTLMATATAVVTSARTIAGTAFTAIYAAAVNTRLAALPENVGRAAAEAGLPPQSIVPFTQALLGHDDGALSSVPGVTPAIIGLGVAAVRQTFADSLRVVFMISAPFGAVACISCFFMSDMRAAMTYHIDAPMEKIHEQQDSSTNI